ncbi:aldo/keto reductase [Salinarchaeum laminariae]|uniref:aldo/keto reductase n=1 Tax=Salinarchaeum laminariae TaxID=869888 RepID=UPI0020BDCE13|nr:aldo/keto reductase [Salinarchaeum laminariae]
MQYETLGNTDVEVSRVGLGLWNISGGSDWEKTDEDDAIETIHTAYDAGVNFFDTAEAYGDGYSEEVLGEALDGMDRDDVVIASKVWVDNLAYDDLKAAFEASLDRLGTDYIDVYYLHYQNPEIPVSESMRAVRELQEEGSIRVPAVSNTGPADMEATLEAGRVEANQVPYNLLWRAIEHEVADASRENDVDLVAYSPLAQGLLTGEYESAEEYPTGRMRTRHFSGDRPEARHGEDGAEAETFETVERIRDICEEYDRDMVEVALAWPLHKSGVTSVLAGASSPEHVRANAEAAEVSLSDDLLADLDDATNDLKDALGPNPDPWQSDSRYN